MDFQNRFAVFTAVGLAAFSAGFSLTTACKRSDAPLQNSATTLKPLTEAKIAQATAAPATATRARALAISSATAAQKTAPSQTLSLRRLVVTHAVNAREPAEPVKLVAGSPVLAFVELSNPDSAPRNVMVTFEREGRPPVGHVKLEVPAGSPRFRTWARTRNLNESGTWEAVVRTDDGLEVGRIPFELTRADEARS